MDYSALVEALQNGDEQTANRMCGEAARIIKKYLVSTIDASSEDAEDAVQKMFEYVIPKVRKNEIENPAGLLAYMLTGARHSYYKIVEGLDLDLVEELAEEPAIDPTQIWNLLNEERELILKKCLKRLKGSYRSMIEFLFDFPNADSDDIAEYFDISANNYWIRKHRIIKRLSDCVKNNL